MGVPANTKTAADKYGPTALKVGVGTAVGTACAMMHKGPPGKITRGGLANPASQFAYASVSALTQGATVTGALGAGATAAVGGPAVVASATAPATVAAPFVIGAAVVGAVGWGLYAIFSDD